MFFVPSPAWGGLGWGAVNKNILWSLFGLQVQNWGSTHLHIWNIFIFPTFPISNINYLSGLTRHTLNGLIHLTMSLYSSHLYFQFRYLLLPPKPLTNALHSTTLSPSFEPFSLYNLYLLPQPILLSINIIISHWLRINLLNTFW